MRCAIYYTPDDDHPLGRAAAGWLGRNPHTGAALPAPAVRTLTPGAIAFHTAAPRRYGFHATLKAPFRLAGGFSQEGLQAALDRFGAEAQPVTIPRLVIRQLDGFFALVPERPVAELDALAAAVVEAFDPFRAPLTEAEIQRRNPDALNPEEFRNLCQWGYPYVFKTFRFHMTLTGRVGAEEAPRVRAALEEVIAPSLAHPVLIDSLSLFVEPESGAPFTVSSSHALGGIRQRMTA